MVALFSHLIQSFRCIVSSLAPSVPLLATLSKSYSLNASESQLPQELHKVLDKDFVDKFEEVIVIGDLHGCYDELIQLLDQINDSNNNLDENNGTNNMQNESKRILKLFVGDLVNKGPKNKEVIDFMINNSDSCLSVRGNHDEVVIREYLKYQIDGESGLKEKNKWIKNLTQKQVDYLIQLPYTISIPSLKALVVHAGIVPNVELHKQSLEDMTQMRNLIIHESDDKSVKMFATNKHNKGEPWVKRWKGPQHVYFGHDAKRKLQRTAFSTGLDTGCVYGKLLTGIFISGPRKNTLVSVKANAVHSPPKGSNPDQN